jgi:hypothetical protein
MTTAEQLDHTPLTFGKYAGKTPDQISEVDPNWLCWAYENVKTKPTCSTLLYKSCLAETRDSQFHTKARFNG